MERELRRRRWIVHTKIQGWNEKDEIIRLREERNCGPNKIEAYLKNKQDKVPPVGHDTIYRIICDAGLNNALERKRRT